MASPAKTSGAIAEPSPAKPPSASGAPEGALAIPAELMDVGMSSDNGDAVQCSKCGEETTLDDLDNVCRDKFLVGRKTQLIEKVCGLNYTCVLRRWKDNPRLKSWWNAKTEDQRTAWYKEHKDVRGKQATVGGGAGKNRIIFTIVEEELNSIGQDRKMRRVWKSQKMRERDRCLEDPSFPAKSSAARDQAWHQALLDDGIAKQKIDCA